MVMKIGKAELNFHLKSFERQVLQRRSREQILRRQVRVEAFWVLIFLFLPG